MTNNQGFTLIELLVVITIVGVISLLLGTSLQGTMGAYRLEGEVKRLKTDIMSGRARAMQRNLMHFMQIDMGVNGYQLFQDDGNGIFEPGVDTAVFPNPKVFKDPLLSGGGIITIDTRGLMSGGAMVSFNYIPGKDHDLSDYDCLDISPTRISVGQLDGADCDAR